MELEGTAHIGVAIHAVAFLPGHREIEVVIDDRGDTFGVQGTDRERIGVDRRGKKTPLAGRSASNWDHSFRWFSELPGLSGG